MLIIKNMVELGDIASSPWIQQIMNNENCILLFFLSSRTYELSVKSASITSSPEGLDEEAFPAVSSGPVPADDGPAPG